MNTSQLSHVIEKTTFHRNGRLLATSLIFAIWSASSCLYAVMEQLNTTYEVEEGRSFWRVRGTALLLTLLFVVLVLGAFALILLGEALAHWPESLVGSSEALRVFVVVGHWIIIFLLLLLGFACIYYFGPNVKQRFFFVSPGSVAGTLVLVGISLLFRLYINHFGTFNTTYGSLGVVILLMMWLYSAGWVIRVGSEINALIERYSTPGKPREEIVKPPHSGKK